MKKNKKILLSLIIFVLVFLFNINVINAATCKINVSAPSSSVVGQTFNVTVTVSSNAALGSWDYTLGYDSSKVSKISGTTRIVDYGNGSKKSATYSYKFKALKSGSVTFTPKNAEVLDYSSTNPCLSSVGSKTVTMRTQAEIEASYSRNNNLSSLSVEGAELTPAFKKDITEYNVILPVDTTKAKINASVEDKTASVVGTGEVNVVDGINKFEVVVTAQHGEKKTYILNITVEELDPIVVNVDNNEYTVVRKKGLVENIPTGFVDKAITINDQTINAYYNGDANITLVGLKDKTGSIKLFRYEDDKYYSFNEIKTAGLNLLILDDETDIPLGFNKTTLTINDTKVVAYKYENLSVYLVYAINLEDGSKKLYNYDKYSNTFQVYTSTLPDYLNERIKIREYIIMGLMGLSFILLLIAIFKKGKSKKENNKEELTGIEKVFFEEEKPKKTIYEENDISIEDVKIKEELEVKKIEDTDYKIPKRSKKQRQKEINDAKKKLNEAKRSFKRVSLDDDE